MSQRSSLFLYEYRAAIALNNMAVTLLERGAPRPALDTLKDCVGLMESALRQQQQQQHQQQQQQQQQEQIALPSDTVTAPAAGFQHRPPQDPIPSMLQRACKRLSRAPLRRGDDNVCVVHHDGTFLQASSSKVLRQLFQNHSPLVAPARLETFDHQCLGERNPELESGIMLYNFGLSYLCLSRGRAPPNERGGEASSDRHHLSSAKLRDVAAALFAMSYEIVAKPDTLQHLLDCAVMDGRCLEPRLDTRLRLAHLALNALLHAQDENGRHRDAAHTHYRLLQLSGVLREMGLDPAAHEACSVTDEPSLHAAAA